jgi:ectoine hydroxylase-related dioxygenase (phytanoyl-CoA dioxygenase family)
MTTLDHAKQMVSDLWLDQDDAHDEIERRLGTGRVSGVEAERLHHFTDNGYLTISLDLDDRFYEAFEADLERLWSERPIDLAVAARAGDRQSFRDIDSSYRSVGYRIADPHSHSASARELYLNGQIFRMVELIFDQKAIAFQSLYFQFGSEQSLHRDPMFVVTRPPSHLLASWTALEDITPTCGPLLYVPGSHRMPWYEFADDTVSLPTKKGVDDERDGWSDFRARMIDEMNLEAQAFTCKRGDTFIWHGGLLHGGLPVRDQSRTRKSYVVHYSTAAHYNSRQASMQMKFVRHGNPVWRKVEGTTSRTIERDGHVGIDNPLREMKVPRRRRRVLRRARRLGYRAWTRVRPGSGSSHEPPSSTDD